MSTALQTVQQIYAAFARGDIPAIVELLDDNVQWETWADSSAHAADVPWLRAGNGKAAALRFFEEIGAFAPKAFPLARIRTFARYADLADAVETGGIEAGISMSPRPEFLVHVAGDRIFLPVGNAIATRSESFIAPRGDADILAYLNSWIRYRSETGWLKARRDYWFGSFAWADQLEAK